MGKLLFFFIKYEGPTARSTKLDLAVARSTRNFRLRFEVSRETDFFI